MQPPKLSAGRDHASGDMLSGGCGLPTQEQVSSFYKLLQNIYSEGENGSPSENRRVKVVDRVEI